MGNYFVGSLMNATTPIPITQPLEEEPQNNKRFRRSSMDPNSARLRCLCLHGYGSNNDITSIQVDNMRLEALGIACDLFEAMHQCPAQNDILRMFSEEPFRTWVLKPHHGWDLTCADDAELRAMRVSMLQSLREASAIIAAHGPYDIIYGFSMGAAFATALCTPAIWSSFLELPAPPCRFVICACAGGLGLLEAPALSSAFTGNGSDREPCAVPATRDFVAEQTMTSQTDAAALIVVATSMEEERQEKKKESRSSREEVSVAAGDKKGVAGLESDASEHRSQLLEVVGKTRHCIIPDKNIKSFHIIGRSDPGKADSEQIAELFASRVTYELPFGHELPMQLRRDEDFRRALAAFLATAVAPTDR